MQQVSPARSKIALSNLSLANIPTSVYKVLLLLVTMAWGASFVYMKDMVAVFPPGWLLGIRFTIAGLVILPFLLKRLRLRLTWKALAAGMVMGLLDFLGFFTQTVGLQTVSPGINAFLTAVYVVLVPFMWWVVAKRKPTKANIVAAFVAIVGIWLVSVTSASGSLSIGFGEIMTPALCVLLCGAYRFGFDLLGLLLTCSCSRSSSSSLKACSAQPPVRSSKRFPHSRRSRRS